MPIYILMFIKSYWKQLLLAILLVVGCYLVYNRIYHSGYDAASAVYEIRIKEYSDKLDKRISTIETNSTVLVSAAASAAANRTEEMSAITALAKKKVLFTVKGEKCTPSQDFLNSYNSLISRGNQK